MRWKLKIMIRFFLRFGLVSGVILFIKFKLGRVKSIKVPNIKHPFSLRHGTSDIPAFYQVFLERQYNIDFAKPQVIIDAGANIGLFALLMKNKYPEAKIICIEPDIDNFSLLQKNVSAYNDIFCENCGVWNKDTKLKVYDKYNMGKWGMVVEEDVHSGNISAVSINTLIEKYSLEYIDILKLDIETSEKTLFLNNYDDWLPKVRVIVIEFHDWVEENCSKPFFEAINKSFTKYKYSVFVCFKIDGFRVSAKS